MAWYKETKKEEIEKFICDVCSVDYGEINQDSTKFINNKWHCYSCIQKLKDEFAKTCEHNYNFYIDDDWDNTFKLYCEKKECGFDNKIEKNIIIDFLKVNFKKKESE